MAPMVSFVFGNQKLSIDETARQWVDEVLEDREPDFCYERFNLEEMLKDKSSCNSMVEQLQLSCETIPFLSDRKVIRLDHIEKLKSPRKKDSSSQSNEQKIHERLVEYLGSAPDYLWFVFTGSINRETDLTSPLLKLIKNKGRIKKFVSYEDQSPVQWVCERSRKKGIGLNGQIAQLLIDLVGKDLGVLDQELEKLALLVPPGHQITEPFLIENINVQKYSQAYRILESLSNKHLLPALETLEQVSSLPKKDRPNLINMLARQFRKFLKIEYQRSAGKLEKQILGTLGVHPFIGKKILEQSRKFSVLELENITKTLANQELRIMFEFQHSKVRFQDLFQQICTGSFRNEKA